MDLLLKNGSKITIYPSNGSKVFHTKKWCHVCNNNWDDHIALECDGETCIYCGGVWNECECGEPTRRQ